MFWESVAKYWDEYGPNLLTYGALSGDWGGTVRGAATGVIGRATGEWATAQLGKTLGSFAGPVGSLIGFGLGSVLGNAFAGLFGGRGAPRLEKSHEMDWAGAHMLAGREALNRLENEARSGFTYQVDRTNQALNQATTSDRRLGAAQAERLPGFYDAVNQAYGQVMQQVVGMGREHQFRTHQLALEALKQQDAVRLEQERLRAMRLQAVGQMIGGMFNTNTNTNR